VTKGGDLVALAPLYRERTAGGVRLLPLGVSLSDYGDVLVRDDCPEALAVLAQTFAARPEPVLWTDLPPFALASHAPVPEGWRAESGEGETCPVLALAGATSSPDDAPSCVPAGRRRKVRMALHRASRRGDISIVTQRDVTPGAFLDALRRLHGERWRSRGESGVLDDEAVMRFHALALPRLVAAGLADYRLLSIGGELAGAYLGLRDERRAYAYIGGMDPAFASESPGAILLNAAISDAVARGAEEFHFLRGGEAYKYGWGAVDRRNRWRRLEPGGDDG
jgi:CelD/BcsL family acetyltransferase involved in cellulose biosynthesis